MANEAPPPLIHCARVLHYALVDATVRYTRCSVVYVGDVELGAVPRLAIVRNLVDDDILSLHCDDNWACLGSSGKGDIDSVMSQANRLYEGLEAKWLKAPYSDTEFAKAVADTYRDERCSFCGRYHFEIDEKMVEGDRAMICAACVERLHGALHEMDDGDGGP